MNKIKEYFDHIGFNKATKEAKNTMIGVILVKFGTGAIGIWGIINIYFFSYYKKYDDDLKMSEFTFLITFAAIPMSIVTIFSVRLAQIYGFKRMIRSAMIINPISIMLGSFQDNFYTFALFNTFIASLCFGSTVMPVLYCLWSHFPKKTGNATGIALASFGLATFFYSLIATHIVNPQNIPATIEYTEGSQTYYLFEGEVSGNVPAMTFWLGLIQMIFCIPGAFLISNNENNIDILLNERNEEEVEKELEMNLLGSNYEKNVVIQQEEQRYNNYQDKAQQQPLSLLQQQQLLLQHQNSANSHCLYPPSIASLHHNNNNNNFDQDCNNQNLPKSPSTQYLLEWNAQLNGQKQISNESAQYSSLQSHQNGQHQIPPANNEHLNNSSLKYSSLQNQSNVQNKISSESPSQYSSLKYSSLQNQQQKEQRSNQHSLQKKTSTNKIENNNNSQQNIEQNVVLARTPSSQQQKEKKTSFQQLLSIRYEQNNLTYQQKQQQQQQQQGNIIQQQGIINDQPKEMTLIQAAKSTPFLIIYSSTFLLSCFSLFISLNFKTYGLTKINDDHFLTYLITICSLVSSISNLGWGYLVDKYNFKTVYLNLIIVIFISGFLFPYVSSSKLGFFIVFQILGASERGLYTIIGPGLVQIFGMKLGAELFPIKSTSFFLALVVLPLLQLLLLQYFDFDQTVHILLIGIIVSYCLSSKLSLHYHFNS